MINSFTIFTLYVNSFFVSTNIQRVINKNYKKPVCWNFLPIYYSQNISQSNWRKIYIDIAIADNLI